MMRERLFLVIAAVFLFLTISAGLIGWSTSSTANHVYAASIPLMQSGVSMAPNPFANVSHLSLQRNLGVYFFLIGSLLAIIIGYSATLRDRISAMLTMVLSRPVSKRTYMIGKVFAVTIAIAIMLVFAFIVSLLLATLLPELSLTSNQIVELAIFYAVSWIYLTIFGLLGLISGLLAKSHTMALVLPMAFWIIIGFVVPQVISGVEPVALLNPVTIATDTQPAGIFAALSSIIGPFSFAEQYKQISLSLFEFQKSPLGVVPYLSVGGAFILAWVGVWWAVGRYQPSERIAS
ncbi:MAG: hypothetical protein JWP06_624 [Candidatus Saccharibacteria bacterium]|nr:hypothetical protein [Candidatus Saccharibacteria bacterium]